MTSIRQQAREMGVHPSTVSRAIREGRDLGTIKHRAKRPPALQAALARAKAARDDLDALIAKLQDEQGKLERLADALRDGMSADERADRMGASRSAVQRLMARHGIAAPGRVTSRPVSTLDQVADMKPMEAVEHLTYIVDEMRGGKDDIGAVILKLGLTRQQAMIYTTLASHAGKPVSHAALMSAASTKPGQETQKDALNVQIFRLRKKMPPGETIRTIKGYGYILERKSTHAHDQSEV